MAPATPNPIGDPTRERGIDSVAEELTLEGERLRKLAEELRASAEAQAEMRANYPYFKTTVYAALREKFLKELPPLPDKDLEAVAKEEGSLPLEAFIDELERLPENAR